MEVSALAALAPAEAQFHPHIIQAFHFMDVFSLHPLGSSGSSERKKKNGIIKMLKGLIGVQVSS